MSASDRWRDVLVAIDVGTSGARAAAFDLEGNRRLEVRRGYPTSTPRIGWAEQDPLAWRSAALSATRELVLRLGPARRVHAIGLTGQCPSVVLVDAIGRPTRPGLLYRDNRATVEARDMRDRLGAEWLHRRTGHLAAAFHIVPKLLWIRRHEPEAWASSAVALQPRDWLAFILTGELATDPTHAAATLAYDLVNRRWDPEIVSAVDLPVRLFPAVLPSGSIVGQLRPNVASRLGLARATPVVIGGADSQACALGAGVVAEGPVSEMAGSSTCLNAVTAEPLAVLQVTHYPHVVGSDYTTETGINTTGEAIGWLADMIYGGGRRRAEGAAFERLDRDASQAPPLADGVMAVPAFADGERDDPELRAAFVGLSLRHDRGVLARALLEGVAFTIRSQLELLGQGGLHPNELRISGGDTRLATWNRIKADVTGLPVRVVGGDAAVAGVAMLAGLGASIYRDAADAVARCVRLEPAIEPDAAAYGRYSEAFGAFRALQSSPAIRQTRQGVG
jgi:sugar (pentulose or hexulose) kinase